MSIKAEIKEQRDRAFGIDPSRSIKVYLGEAKMTRLLIEVNTSSRFCGINTHGVWCVHGVPVKECPRLGPEETNIEWTEE